MNKNKLVYVVIVGANMGQADNLREACKSAGIKVNEKTFTEIDLHTVPINTVDRFEPVEEVDSKGKVKSITGIVPKWRGAFMTLSAQQLASHLHQYQRVKVKLLKGSTQISISEEEEDEEDETPSTPPPPKK